MAIEDLRQGAQDLIEGISKRRAGKIKAAQAQQKQLQLNALSNDVLSSTEGQTTSGRLLGKSLQLGLVEPKDVSSQLLSMDRHKLFFSLQSRILAEKDPAQRQKLMEASNKLLDVMNRVNQTESYFKSLGAAYGTLQAKSEYGVLKKGGGGGGGGGGSGGGDGGLGQRGPDGKKSTKVAFDLDFLGNKIARFLQTDDLGQKLTNVHSPILHDQNLTPDEQTSLNQRILDYARKETFEKYPELKSAPNGEAIVSRMAVQATEGYNKNGISVFGGTSTSDGLKVLVPFGSYQELSNDDILAIDTYKTKKGKKGPESVHASSLPPTQLTLPPPRPKKKGIFSQIGDFIAGPGDDSEEPVKQNPTPNQQNDGQLNDFQKQILSE